MDMKGQFIIEAFDSRTGEKLWERAEDNIITMYRNHFTTGGSNLNVSGLSITMSEEIVAYDVLCNNRNVDAVPYTTRLQPGPVEHPDYIYIPSTGVTPAIWEVKFQFAQPGAGNARNIRTIYLGDSNANNRAILAYVEINPACFQGDFVVFDVTYRIQVMPGTTTNLVDFDRSADHDRIVEEFLCLGDTGWPTGAQFNAFPYSQGYISTDPIRQYWGSFCGYRFQSETGTFFYNKFKRRFNASYSDTSNVGRMIQSVQFGNDRANGDASGHPQGTAWATATPSNFPNKPLQPVFNHSSANTVPFQDVNELAFGKGSITVDGSSWTDPDFPHYYDIQMVNTGEVATARYWFRRRHITGFNGNTFRDDWGHLPWFRNRSQTWTSLDPNQDMTETTGNRRTFPAGNGVDPRSQIEEYTSGFRVIVWKAGGITLVSLAKGDFVEFNPTTTPALPVSSIQQCEADDNGNIWVADSASGLYRISDPLGSPTVTLMTVATHGIPSDGNCHAVAQGAGDTIFALFTSGLAKCSNPNAATPTFVTQAFTFTGISDANWTQVKWMRVDRSSSNNELGLAYLSAGQVNVAWWSEAGSSFTGPNINSSILDTYDNLYIVNRFRCSYSGGLWCAQNDSVPNCYYLEWGLTTKTELVTGGTSQNRFDRRMSFKYDIHGVPYAQTEGTTGGSSGSTAWSRKYRNTFPPGRRITNNDYSTQTIFEFERPANWTNLGLGWSDITSLNERTNGIFMKSAWGDLSTTASKFGGPAATLNAAQPYKEFMWEDYRWNGASWVKDYHDVAIDTGLGPGVPGARLGFEIESHTFTGRSNIDVLPLFAIPVFAGPGFTFACQVTGAAKGAYQEADRCLFFFDDQTSGKQFYIYWDQGGSVVVGDETGPIPVGPTPADGTAYNLSVSVTYGAPDLIEVWLTAAAAGVPVQVLPPTPLIGLPLAPTIIHTTGPGGVKVGSSNPQFPDDFYSGALVNVLFEAIPWTGVERTAHHAAPATYLSPANVAQYTLTHPLSETKVTHVSTDALLDGITVSFANGGSPDAFVDGDWHSFGLVDGILKDNATTFSWQHDLFTKPVDYDVADFEDPNSPGSAVISASAVQITEPVAWRKYALPPTSNTQQIFIAPGQAGAVGVDATFVGLQKVSAVGDYVEYKVVSFFENNVYVGIDPSTAELAASSMNWTFRVWDNTWEARVNNGVVASGTPSALGDVYRVELGAGGDVLFKINGGTVWTETGTQWTGDNYLHYQAQTGAQGTAYDCVVNWTRPAYTMDLGLSGSNTGRFSAGYLRMDDVVFEFNLNATPAAAINIDDDNAWGDLPAPGVGEVTVCPDAGIAIFNAADVGKTVTGKYTVIRND